MTQPSEKASLSPNLPVQLAPLSPLAKTFVLAGSLEFSGVIQPNELLQSRKALSGWESFLKRAFPQAFRSLPPLSGTSTDGEGIQRDLRMRIAGRGAAPVHSPLLKSKKKFCNSYVKRDTRLSSASEPAVWCGEGGRAFSRRHPFPVTFLFDQRTHSGRKNHPHSDRRTTPHPGGGGSRLCPRP